MEGGLAGQPNAYSLSLMMSGFSRSGNFYESSRLWSQLRTQGWVDTVALNAWLRCCVRGGLVPQALQAFQQVKLDSPHLQLDVITFSTLIHGLVHQGGGAAAARALRLWAEMRSRDVLPDDGIARDLMIAATRVDVTVALRLRIALQRLGWSERRLAPHVQLLRPLLPPLAEVMADEEAWASLGVRPMRLLGSEIAQLELSPVCSETARDRAARDRLQARRGGAAAAAAAGAGGRSAKGAAGYEGAPDPSSASEEIFERHGWNEVKSGWSGLGF